MPEAGSVTDECVAPVGRGVHPPIADREDGADGFEVVAPVSAGGPDAEVDRSTRWDDGDQRQVTSGLQLGGGGEHVVEPGEVVVEGAIGQAGVERHLVGVELGVPVLDQLDQRIDDLLAGP